MRPSTTFEAVDRRLQLLLAALIADEGLDDAGLDSFMASARTLADQWLS
jgi:hypothetical protein